MVVRITTGRSIRGALSYNERKVAKGNAEILVGVGYPCNPAGIGFSGRLERFLSLTELDPKTKTNTVHISLNFSPDEIISQPQMKAIALEYMDKIGFGEQPYLVYFHKDTKHDHLHIVTTNIRDVGKPIKLHYLARDKSEPARKAIEEEFGLIRAQDRKAKLPQLAFAADLLPQNYGQEEVKHRITNALAQVLSIYKYCSLGEMNAVLRQIGVVADRGEMNSRIHQMGGLVYSMIDKEGNRIGRSIKASDIYNSFGAPTLKNLEQRFLKNMVKKDLSKDKFSVVINNALVAAKTAKEFAFRLTKSGIRLHFEQNKIGIIQTLYFVDTRFKCVFSHAELGVNLSDIYALRAATLPTTQAQAQQSKRIYTDSNRKPAILEFGTHSTIILMNALFAGKQNSPGPAGDPPRKKKKKRRPPFS